MINRSGGVDGDSEEVGKYVSLKWVRLAKISSIASARSRFECDVRTPDAAPIPPEENERRFPDVTGFAPPLPAFGTRFDNEVAYVGPVEREMLRRYDTGDAFATALQDGGFD